LVIVIIASDKMITLIETKDKYGVF